DRGARGQIRADEACAASGHGCKEEVFQRIRISAVPAARRERRLSAIDGAQRSDRRRLVARHAGAQKAWNRDGRDDADDRHDDQQLDEGETFGVAQLLHQFCLLKKRLTGTAFPCVWSRMPETRATGMPGMICPLSNCINYLYC